MKFDFNQMYTVYGCALQFEHLEHSTAWVCSSDRKRLLQLSPGFEKIFEVNRDILFNDFASTWQASIADTDKTIINHAAWDDYQDNAGDVIVAFYRISTPRSQVKHVCEISAILANDNVCVSVVLEQAPAVWKAYRERLGAISVQDKIEFVENFSQSRIKDQRCNSSMVNTTQGSVSITARELEVIQYLHQGYSAKQTAEVMEISPRTVEMHLRHIKSKLRVKTKHAVLAAMGITERDDAVQL